MTDENKKTKLKITVQAFRKYNDRNRVAAKQINRHRDTESSEHISRKTKSILTNRHRSRLAGNKCTQRLTESENETICSPVI